MTLKTLRRHAERAAAEAERRYRIARASKRRQRLVELQAARLQALKVGRAARP